MEKFSYLIWVLFFAVIWLPIFLSRPDLRKQSLTVGAFVALLTPLVGWWYLQDYWNPVFFMEINLADLRTSVEELFLGFFTGAISSVAYETVFKKRLDKEKRPITWAFPFLMLGSMYLFAAFLVWQTGLNSIYASFVAFILGIALMVILRRDLVKAGFISGLLFSAILFLSYVVWLEVLFPGTIEKRWFLSNLSHLLVLGIPVEEIVWGFLWGWVAGMIYKVWQGLSIRGFVDKFGNS